jgi:hypothetical protein
MGARTAAQRRITCIVNCGGQRPAERQAFVAVVALTIRGAPRRGMRSDTAHCSPQPIPRCWRYCRESHPPQFPASSSRGTSRSLVAQSVLSSGSRGRHYYNVKFIEQQLIAALVETPPETECSLSAEILKGIGLTDTSTQATWLEKHRPANNGKTWHCLGTTWEYTAKPVARVSDPRPIAVPGGSNWRTSQATSERRLTPIVVKPLPPLRRQK